MQAPHWKGVEPEEQVTRHFSRFACFDWSGAAGPKQKGIALALAETGDDAPRLVERPGGWSRTAALAWIEDAAAAAADLLIGIDFSASLPFADRGGFFPGWSASPADARGLWALVESICRDDPHLAATSFPLHDNAGRHYRRMDARAAIVGEAFEAGVGRLRVVEARCRAAGLPAISSFNLIGAAQVGRSSLTGMRVLYRLDGHVPVWPFDPVPESGPMIVEIYTSLAAAAGGRPGRRAKMRDVDAVNAVLAGLGSAAIVRIGPIDDHQADALVGAAWLRRAAHDDALWHPAPLRADPSLVRTEGWTFGVP